MEIHRLSPRRDQSAVSQPPHPVVRQPWREALIFVVAAAVSFVLAKGAIALLHSPAKGLPYSDRFASSDNSEWAAYGGNWKVEGGHMVNESNERGAKLVAGSPYWTDYSLQADVALRSLGDAGLIARVSDPEQGVDAYSGIYVGLRIRDQALIIGTADHNWHEVVDQHLASPILPNTWYHFDIRLEGCKVDAIVHREDSSEMGRKEITLDSCPLRGKIGLRSYDSGGIWKQVRVTKLRASR